MPGVHLTDGHPATRVAHRVRFRPGPGPNQPTRAGAEHFAKRDGGRRRRPTTVQAIRPKHERTTASAARARRCSGNGAALTTTRPGRAAVSGPVRRTWSGKRARAIPPAGPDIRSNAQRRGPCRPCRGAQVWGVPTRATPPMACTVCSRTELGARALDGGDNVSAGPGHTTLAVYHPACAPGGSTQQRNPRPALNPTPKHDYAPTPSPAQTPRLRLSGRNLDAERLGGPPDTARGTDRSGRIRTWPGA